MWKIKNKLPDINTYEWLRHIYKQCPNITLNKQIKENATFYRAVVTHNTEKTIRKLNQYRTTWSKIVLCLAASLCGCFITIKGCQDYINLVATEPTPELKESLDRMLKDCALIIGGVCLATFVVDSIKIYKKHAKLKKTREINQKMMHKLESLNN